jgi:hypothetical protein
LVEVLGWLALLSAVRSCATASASRELGVRRHRVAEVLLDAVELDLDRAGSDFASGEGR